MLRTLKHAFNAPRLIGLKATTLSSAVTVNISPGDFHAATSSGAGLSLLTPGDTFNRIPVCVGSPFAIGTAPSFQVTPDPTALAIGTRTGDAGTPTDGTFNAFILGYDSQDADYLSFCPFTVKNAWNAARLETFKITPHATTPSITIGSSKGTLTRNGVGDYTVTFKRAFSSDNVIAVGSVYKDTAAHFHVVSCSATAVRVVVGTAGSASDAAPFYLVVQGSDNPEIGYRGRKVTKISDRLPRLIAGQISYSAGVPSIVTGTGDFTLTDNGTGAVNVEFTKPFLREPIVIASKDNAGNVTIGAPLDVKTSCNLYSFNAAGATADPNDVHFMAFGYDDAQEYGI